MFGESVWRVFLCHSGGGTAFADTETVVMGRAQACGGVAGTRERGGTEAELACTPAVAGKVGDTGAMAEWPRGQTLGVWMRIDMASTFSDPSVHIDEMLLQLSRRSLRVPGHRKGS